MAAVGALAAVLPMPSLLQMPDLAARAVVLVCVLAATLAVQHLAVGALRRALDASRVPSASIFLNVVRVILWSLALLVVLDPVFGIQPTAFLAALGVTSVVISLGLQDTVSNMVAGLGLMAGRVVSPEDQVTIGDFSGMVTDVTWRSTVVRDRAGKVEVIPNAVLNKTALARRTRWEVTCVRVPLCVAHGFDLSAVEDEVQAIAREALAGRLDEELGVEVRFGALRPHGIDGEVILHIADDQTPSACADLVVRALSGSPWLARGIIHPTS